MEPKERSALVSEIKDDLGGLIGASGRPEELVKLTTRVVQGVKRLLQDVPDPISSLTTTSLASFIKSAQVIAKNPRGVDSRAITELSTCRKDVETRLDVLEKWHLARDISVLRRSSPEGELEEVMDSIVKPTPDQRRETRKASPEEPAVSDKEQKLTWQLQGKRDGLLLKMEPQRAPPEVGDITESLTAAVKGLMRGADELTSHSDKKVPSKDQLLEPMIVITDKVCMLLDIVDTLFDSKYPMRAQVYSFCSALLDNVLAYGCRSKANDITSLRSIGTQTPALLNAAKVMVEQCERKCNNKDTAESDGKKVSPVPPVSSSPLPPSSVPAASVQAASVPAASIPATSAPATSVPVTTQEAVKKETQIYCIVCTTVAVDQKTQQPISKGTELSLTVHESTTVNDVKQDLSVRTGLPLVDIQFIQGQSELSDTATINTKSPLPFFLFNRSEPTEEERRLQRKDERNKSRMKIYDLDWTLVTGPIAVALYEYDTLGDDSNLAFDEGDVIEIIEKGGDGWWEGRIADNTGSFPASFVEEIKSRDEGVKLLEVLKRKKSGPVEEDTIQDSAKPPPRQSSEGNVSQPNLLSKLKRIGGSTPDFTSSISSSDKKNLFKKKKPNKGYTNLTVQEEEEDHTHSPEPVHKPLEGKRSKPEVKVKPKSSSRGRSLHLPRVMGASSPVSPSTTPTPDSPEPTSVPSPQMNYKRGVSAGGKEGGAKRRPPPPRPPPFASTHPTQAAKLDVIIKLQASIDESDETTTTDVKTSQEDNEKIEEILSFASDDPLKWEEPGKVATPTEEPLKTTNSMEDLLNNLKEFDESTTIKSDPPYATLDEVQTDVLYEVIAPPTDTPSPDDVVTIKISDYRPDTDDELDAELAVLETEEVAGANKKGGAVDGLLFTEEENWNPREWAPSPEPEVRRPPRSKKPPSWSYNVSNSPKLEPKTNGDKPHPPPDKPQSPSTKDNQLPVDSTSRSLQGSPLPPPNIISRPRKSPQGSPLLANKIEKAPPPVPPPRQKRPRGAPPAPPTSKGPVAPPGRPAPPPPKPYGVSSDKGVKPHPS